ncbi:hypothetical protein [Streptomyces sp. NPDC056983]|uniref:hypothetical protein n=1 Tax=Streptomyces sp. NPDC056983 TaxID=3345987 RepID=UPI00363AA17F
MHPDTEPIITLTTRTGATHTRQVTDPLGSATNPLDAEAVATKFHGLARRVVPQGQARSIADTVERLDTIHDSHQLVRHLSILTGPPARRRTGPLRQRVASDGEGSVHRITRAPDRTERSPLSTTRGTTRNSPSGRVPTGPVRTRRVAEHGHHSVWAGR